METYGTVARLSLFVLNMSSRQLPDGTHVPGLSFLTESLHLCNRMVEETRRERQLVGPLVNQF